MTYLTDAAAQVIVPILGMCGILLVGWVHEWLYDLYYGYVPLPRWMTRRYWHGVLVRVVCRLAELEARFEQRKSPRKAATKRGMVGRRVRRSACEYSQIIPQSAGNVKGDFAVAWKWMRG